MQERTWRVADMLREGEAPELATWPYPLRQLLFNRGLSTALRVDRFLYPERVGMHDPFLLKGMPAAVERIHRALRDGEKIAVYGDFDADGLTGVALLIEVLGSSPLHGQVVSYLPHRLKEGYGLHTEAVRALAGQGTRLLVTVDCGIGADEEIRLAGRLGMDVVVTDHHQVPDEVPPAVAVLNPRQPGCSYPFKELAGVGMAYKLAEAVLAQVVGLGEARDRLASRLDLVALGTVADMAPLLDENRLMVKLGLEQINRGSRPGLRALAVAAGFAGRVVDSDGIGWWVGPRLNAAGRMGDARLGLDLLTTASEVEAARLAEELETANRDRQVVTGAALNAAREELSCLPELPAALVLVGDYPAGVVGLVAGWLADEFNRPCFVIEVGETESRGSGRGIPGFDVVRALAEASDLLIRYGGHSQAGGFALPTGRIAALEARLQRSARTQLGEVTVEPELCLEAAVRVTDIGAPLFAKLALLEPYGIGNERPLFFTPRVLVRDARVVGTGHLKLWLSDETGTTAAIGFGMGTPDYAFARQGSYVDCAYRVSRNKWNDNVGYEMMLKGLRPHRLGPR